MARRQHPPEFRQQLIADYLRTIDDSGGGTFQDATSPRKRVNSTWRKSTTDCEHRAPPRSLRFLNVAPRPPAHWSGPFGACGGAESVRSHGATTRDWADRTTRNAGKREKDPPRPHAGSWRSVQRRALLPRPRLDFLSRGVKCRALLR
jgi:hypothetical protein